jgi:hypothetical protein
MSAPVLELLTEGVALRPWLERQLVGPDLLEVVEELTAIQGKTEPAGPAMELLTERRSTILAAGLSALSDREVEMLYQSPSVLLRLQEWVLLAGGPYWNGVLSQTLARPGPPASRKSPRLWSRLFSHAVAAAAAVAATLFVVHWSRRSPTPPEERPSAFATARAPAEDMLTLLRGRIDQEWSGLRRQHDTRAVLDRMERLCAELHAGEYGQLSASACEGVCRDLDRLARQIAAQRARLNHDDDLLVRAQVESAVNALVVRRWRDPGDLPDTFSDPEDLPGTGNDG